MLSSGVLLLHLFAVPQSVDASAARSWTQSFGNALGTSRVDVEPARSEPATLWEVETGAVVGDPVTWDGLVYVAAKGTSGHVLRMYGLEKGALLATGQLGKDTPLGLIAWDEFVGVARADGVHVMTFNAKDKKLVDARVLDATLPGAPRVLAAMAYAPTSAGLRIFDLKYGNLRGTLPLEHGSSAVRLGGAWGPPMFAGVMTKDATWFLRGIEVSGLAGAKIEALGASEVDIGTGALDALDATIVARLQPEAGAGAWLVIAAAPLTLKDGSSASTVVVGEGAGAKVTATPFVGAVAIHEGAAFGFDADGALLRVEASGSSATITPADPAAVRGPITIARDVAYVGGRAIDLNSGKVLWSLKKPVAERRMIPAGDLRFVFAEKSKLVCAGVRSNKKAASEAGGAAVASKPGSGDGVIRSDGVRIAGAVTAGENGAWRVQEESGRSWDLGAAEVAAVESAGEFKLVGEEHAVHRAWLAVLHAEHRERLVEAFNTFLKARLTEDCKRLVDEAKRCALDTARVGEMTAKMLATKPPDGGTKESQRTGPLKKENELRKRSRASFTEAAAWCSANSLRLCATNLLIGGEELAPAEPKADALVAELIPEGFPWREDPSAGVLWRQWAKHLLRSGGEFVPKSDTSAWRRARTAPWNAGMVILRSPNAVLYSRDETPEIVGGTLDAAEFAVRLLQRLLPPDPDASQALLEIRLLYDRAEYLRERGAGGRLPMAWTAGYYSESEGISRFYVPRGEEAKDPLGRGFYATISHELTHHYLDMAWISRKAQRSTDSVKPDLPGYWIIEGTARFIEDQVASSLRAESGLAQRDAVSAYITKVVASENKLIKVQRLIDLPQKQFQSLSDETLCKVPLPDDATRALLMTERGVFYEESGCLVFFLMYRAGHDVRAKLVEYLRTTYMGTVAPEGWLALGFEKAEALDAAFKSFVMNTNR